MNERKQNKREEKEKKEAKDSEGKTTAKERIAKSDNRSSKSMLD
jgi:hypothetical protein